MTVKTNANGFTEEEQAELDQADAEVEEQIATEKGGKTAAPETEAEPTETEGEEEKPAASPQTTDKAKPPSGYVPISALHEVRKEAQEARERAAKLEGAWSQIQQRLNAPQQQQGQQKEIPPYEQDPLGHLQGQLSAALTEIQTLKGQTQQQTQAQQQQAQFAAVMNHYAQDMSAFSRENPEFTEAYKWLEANAEAEVAARFPWLTPQQRQQVLIQEENALVMGALNNGRRPAEVVFNLAKHRGYKKAEPKQEENKLERLQKGQKAAASLSATKGASNANGQDNMTLETLAELMVSDPDKADEMWAKMAKAGRLG